MGRGDGRTVFSTELGRVCPRCGWPTSSCRCSATIAAGAEQPIPTKITARLRIERAGRKGKTVTVVEGLPRNASFLKDLAGELKRACGTGGAVVEDRIEVQGEQVERLRTLLERKGWKVKG